MSNYLNKTILTSFLVLIGYTSFAQNQSIADSLLEIYNNTSKITVDSATLDLINNISYYHTTPEIKEEFALKLIEQALKLDNNYWLFRGYLQYGNVFQLTGKLDLALDAYLKSTEYAELSGDQRSLAISYSSCGDIYSIAKDHRNSIHYYKKSINLLNQINDSVTLASVYYNIGTEFEYCVIPDSALLYFKKSQVIFTVLNHNVGLAYNKASIARIYGDKGEYDLARTHLIDAIKIFNKLGIAQAEVYFKLTLAQIYLDQHQLNSALEISTSSLKIAEEKDLLPQMQHASNILSQIYKEMGDYENAYNYHFQYITYRDSINNEETIREMADLRTEYEVSQKQAELDLVEKEKQIQKVIGFGLIGGLVLISAMAFVLYRSDKRERASNVILQKQRNKLEEINHAKDRFFSIISHDLRGPLGVLKGSASLIHQLSEAYEDEEIKDLAANMEQSTDKTLNLLNNLLDWALSQSGNYNLEPEDVALSDIILNTLSLYSHTASSKNIALSYTPGPAEASVFADKNSLATILRNLISNALKFTPEGGTVSISIECNETTNSILVNDTGIGIDSKKIKTLFGLKTKRSDWGTAGEKGLGIGLNLVQEFIKLNKGEISVESVVGEGSLFRVTLPKER